MYVLKRFSLFKNRYLKQIKIINEEDIYKNFISCIYILHLHILKQKIDFCCDTKLYTNMEIEHYQVNLTK